MKEDFLCHHGVKGMKWGVRKDRSKSSKTSSNKKEKKKTNRIASVIKGSSKKKSIKKLSDEELQRKVRRLQLEKQYRDLKRDEVSAGRKIVGDILKTSGKMVGTQLATYAAGKAINKALNANIVNVAFSKKKKK